MRLWLIKADGRSKRRVSSSSSSDCNGDQEDQDREEAIESGTYPVPWLALISNKSVIAVMLFKLACYTIMYLNSSELPTYFAHVLRMNVTDIGILVAVSNIAYVAFMIPMPFMSERLIKSGRISRTNACKVSSIIAGLLNALTTAAIRWLGCNKTAVIVVYILNSITMAGSVVSDNAIAADMTRKFRGVLFAMCNVFQVAPGFIAPLYTGVVEHLTLYLQFLHP